MPEVSFYPSEGNPNFKIKIKHVPTGEEVEFIAWVTDFSDNFTSQWNTTPVYGRMDDLATFRRTGRKISLAFDVVAQGQEGALANNAKLDKLSTFLYPVYESAARSASNTLAAAPLLQMSWTNLIQDKSTGEGLLGYLAGFTYKPVIDHGMFVGGTESPGLYFQNLTVSLEFTVIHSHLTGWNNKQFGGDKLKTATPGFAHGAPGQTAPSTSRFLRAADGAPTSPGTNSAQDANRGANEEQVLGGAPGMSGLRDYAAATPLGRLLFGE
jgi:hypothetical protein